MIRLELLAPAKNLEIGIAAIDCGADSVYIAGPRFGARENAGNSFEEIAALCSYAARFGAEVYVTINTILYDSELSEAESYIWEAYRAGCHGIIVQDLGILQMNLPPIPLFASTQTDIRTPEKAAFLESLGFKRLILERELSLDDIKKIREATTCELEFFVHGALCVCYSGQCYLSEYLTHRSANRGECIQACRSNYTLSDETGRVIVKEASLLSLKDYNLSSHIGELAEAGITSFKIEGRLKNLSYVKNIVSHYNSILNSFIASATYPDGKPRFCRKSLGRVTPDFIPAPSATFNRGYTDLYINRRRGEWRSPFGAKYLGEEIGVVTESLTTKEGLIKFLYRGEKINNGDGLSIVRPDGSIAGERANSCTAESVTLNHSMAGTSYKRVEKYLPAGSHILRNYNIAFEKSLGKSKSVRLIHVGLSVAVESAGISFICSLPDNYPPNGNKTKAFKIAVSGSKAIDRDLCRNNIINQLEKSAGVFQFKVTEIVGECDWFYKLSDLNKTRKELSLRLEEAIRKDMSALFDEKNSPLRNKNFYSFKIANAEKKASSATAPYISDNNLSYKANISNHLSRKLYMELLKIDEKRVEPAFEIAAPKCPILMRTKYCIRKELDMCPGKKNLCAERLFLLNGKHKITLEFDCGECEMILKKA